MPKQVLVLTSVSPSVLGLVTGCALNPARPLVPRGQKVCARPRRRQHDERTKMVLCVLRSQTMPPWARPIRSPALASLSVKQGGRIAFTSQGSETEAQRVCRALCVWHPASPQTLLSPSFLPAPAPAPASAAVWLHQVSAGMNSISQWDVGGGRGGGGGGSLDRTGSANRYHFSMASALKFGPTLCFELLY